MTLVKSQEDIKTQLGNKDPVKKKKKRIGVATLGRRFEGEVPYTILHPDMPTSWEEMQKSWIQLKEEQNTFEASFYASEKKVLELTRRLHEEETLNTYIAPKRMRNVFLH